MSAKHLTAARSSDPLDSLIQAMESLSLEPNTSLQALGMNGRYERLQVVAKRAFQINFLAIDTTNRTRVMISVIKPHDDPCLFQKIAFYMLSCHDNTNIFMLQSATRAQMVVVTRLPYEPIPKQLAHRPTSTSLSYRAMLQDCALAERSFTRILEKHFSNIYRTRWHPSPAVIQPAPFHMEADPHSLLSVLTPRQPASNTRPPQR